MAWIILSINCMLNCQRVSLITMPKAALVVIKLQKQLEKNESEQRNL